MDLPLLLVVIEHQFYLDNIVLFEFRHHRIAFKRLQQLTTVCFRLKILYLAFSHAHEQLVLSNLVINDKL